MSANELETMAQQISKEHNKSIDEVRTGLRIMMAEMAVAFGMPEEKAANFLRDNGIPVR